MLLKSGVFDSILLMSHLEGIRESTTMKVDISQHGAFSMIQYGEPYVPLKKSVDEHKEEATVKKRGRPHGIICYKTMNSSAAP